MNKEKLEKSFQTHRIAVIQDLIAYLDINGIVSPIDVQNSFQEDEWFIVVEYIKEERSLKIINSKGKYKLDILQLSMDEIYQIIISL